MILDRGKCRGPVDLRDRHPKRRLRSQCWAGVVGHRNDDGVGRGPLSLRRRPPQLTRNPVDHHADRALNQGIGQRVRGQIGVAPAERHKQFDPLTHRLAGHGGQHRNPVHLGHRDRITALGRQAGVVGDPHHGGVGSGSLCLGGGPRQTPVGRHGETGRARNQTVGERLGRQVGIAPSENSGSRHHFTQSPGSKVRQHGRIGHFEHVHQELRFGGIPGSVSGPHLDHLPRWPLDFRRRPLQQTTGSQGHP